MSNFELRGDFSADLEAMVASLAEARSKLQQRESELAATNDSLALEIAERERVEAALHESEQKYRNLALELDQQSNELQVRNEELDAFAHTVAHDLKTPLAAVMGYAGLLRADAGAMSTEEVQMGAQIIFQGAQKMNGIIESLLLLAGVRKQEVKTGPLQMGSIVTEVQTQLITMIKEYHPEIILPESWPVAFGYAPWVEEVWANYLSNALRYGGRPPRVQLGADCPPRALASPGQPATVRFWVRDNGAGLSPQDQARLFTAFARLGSSHEEGHGLGLSIVRRIVEKLGGQVGVESQVGQGSLFWFTLPCSAETRSS